MICCFICNHNYMCLRARPAAPHTLCLYVSGSDVGHQSQIFDHTAPPPPLLSSSPPSSTWVSVSYLTLVFLHRKWSWKSRQAKWKFCKLISNWRSDVSEIYRCVQSGPRPAMINQPRLNRVERYYVIFKLTLLQKLIGFHFNNNATSSAAFTDLLQLSKTQNTVYAFDFVQLMFLL